MGRQPRLMLLVVALLLPAVMAGCSGGGDMTKDEKENFKGGPMPADFMSKPGARPANAPPK